MTKRLLRAGEKIAFEVDGRHSFTSNTRTLLGRAVARQRLLEARGWSVIRVSWFWWKSGDEKGRAAGLTDVRDDAVLFLCILLLSLAIPFVCFVHAYVCVRLYPGVPCMYVCE